MESSSHLEELQKIGFSANEAKIYLSLIKIGSAKAGTLAKHAELDRSSAYNALNSLLRKGLASYVIIGKIKWFQCSSTKNILTYLSNKVETAREFLPELEKIRHQTRLKENVRLFKGLKGIKSVFEDILENAEENLIFGSEGQFSQHMPLFAQNFVRGMEKRGIRVKSIVRSNRQEKIDTAKIRRVPSTTESPVVTNIYADKIAIIIWSEVPEAILIENRKAADAYRDYFQFMWKSAGK